MKPRILVVDDSATVRKVVERALTDAGYVVDLAADGVEALERLTANIADLVLVDFVMPKMNGFQLAQAIRANEAWKNIALVLMSGRADKIADQFVAQTGAVDAISKPFSPDAVVAVASHAIARANAQTTVAGTTSPGNLFASADADALPVVDEEMQRAKDEEARYRAARASAKRIAEAVFGTVSRLSNESIELHELEESLSNEDPDLFFSLADDLIRLSPGPTGITSLTGRLEHMSLGDVLQMLEMQQQTGVLAVERGGHIVQLCLRDGRVEIVVARGVDPEFLLGRYLLESGALTADALEKAQAEPADGKWLGERLISRGVITEEQKQRALVRQTSELIYEVLRWRKGVFRFERYAQLPQAKNARLGLPIASVLMEGLRRVDEWRLVAEQVHDFDVVFAKNEDALSVFDASALSRTEQTVLDAVDGRRSVRELIAHTHLASFDACRALFQFATSRLIKALPRSTKS